MPARCTQKRGAPDTSLLKNKVERDAANIQCTKTACWSFSSLFFFVRTFASLFVKVCMF